MIWVTPSYRFVKVDSKSIRRVDTWHWETKVLREYSEYYYNAYDADKTKSYKVRIGELICYG